MPPNTFNRPNTQLLSSYNQHAHKLTGKRVWLACSGGRDSMALALATFQLYEQGLLPFCPQLVHVNHGLQLANDDWAEFVSEWAKSMGMPCHIVHANMPQKLDGTDEQSARNARYKVISSLMNHDDVLMLGHHAHDQCETVLMRLFTGAGVAGLSGIGEWSSKRFIDKKAHNAQMSHKQINLWRPWLSITREQITEFTNQHHLAYVDDPTNVIGNNVRSWLRIDLIPTIKQTYPQVVNSVIRSANLLDEANDILTEVYQKDLENTMNNEIQVAPYDLVLDIDNVKIISMARQSQLIHRWLQGDEPTPASKQRVDEILRLIHRSDNDQQAILLWQGSNHQYTVRRYRQQLHRLRGDWMGFLQGLQSENQSRSPYQNDLQENWQKRCEMIKTNVSAKNSKADKITIRPLSKTDKCALNPRQKAQSGKKLMQLLGIPMWERKAVYVLENEEKGGIRLNKILAVITPRETFKTFDVDKNK